jgi:hypothetical protein
VVIAQLDWKPKPTEFLIIEGGQAAKAEEDNMIRKLKSGEYRLYSRKRNPSTGKRRNLGTFRRLEAAKRHERAVQFFKRRG